MVFLFSQPMASPPILKSVVIPTGARPTTFYVFPPVVGPSFLALKWTALVPVVVDVLFKPVADTIYGEWGTLAGGVTTATLEDLLPATAYDLRLVPSFDGTQGPTVDIRVTTLASPSASVALVQPAPTSARLQWTTADSTGTKVQYGASDGTWPAVVLHAPYESSFQDVSAHTCQAATVGSGTGVVAIVGNALTFSAQSGVGRGVRYSHPTNFAFGTGDLTIEFWVWIDSVSGSPTRIISTEAGVWTPGVWLFGWNSGTNTVSFEGNGLTTLSATGALLPNRWTHVALTRKSNVFRLYTDGVKRVESTQTWVMGTTDRSAQDIMTTFLDVGCNGYASGFLNGGVRDLRITKGLARYTTDSFQLAVTRLSGWPSVVLDLPFESEADVSGYASPWEVVGAGSGFVSLTTSSKVGTYALVISGQSGTGKAVRYYHPANFQFGTSDFTMEFWVWIAADSSATTRILANMGGVWGAEKWTFGLQGSKFLFSAFTWGTQIESAVGSFTDTWTHVALARQSNVYRLYVNGVKQSERTSTDALNSTFVDVGSTLITNQWLNGRVDELRITRGVAKYTGASFPLCASVPFSKMASPTSDWPAVVLRAPLDTSFQDASAHRATAVLFGEGTGIVTVSPASKFGTGALAFSNQSGTGRGVRYTHPTNFAFGRSDFTIEAWVWIDSTSSNNTRIISNAATWSDGSWTLGIDTPTASSPFIFAFRDSGVTYSLTSSVGNYTNRWTHVAVTRASDVFRIYVDGVLSGATENRLVRFFSFGNQATTQPGYGNIRQNFELSTDYYALEAKFPVGTFWTFRYNGNLYGIRFLPVATGQIRQMRLYSTSDNGKTWVHGVPDGAIPGGDTTNITIEVLPALYAVASLGNIGVVDVGFTGLNGYHFTGRVDDLRVTRGVARYTSPSFPLPTRALEGSFEDVGTFAASLTTATLTGLSADSTFEARLVPIYNGSEGAPVTRTIPTPPRPVLEFDAASFVATTAGTPVDSWSNAGSIAGFAATASGATRPTVGFADGKPHVAFSRASSQFLQLPASLPLTWFQTTEQGVAARRGVTAFVVARFTGTAGSWERFFDFDGFEMYLGRDVSTTSIRWGLNPVQGATTWGSQDAWRIAGVSTSNTAIGGTVSLYVDSASNPATTAFATALGNRTTSTNYIGRSTIVSDAYLNGDIRHILLYDRAMSAAEIQDRMDALFLKWFVSVQVASTDVGTSSLTITWSSANATHVRVTYKASSGTTFEEHGTFAYTQRTTTIEGLDVDTEYDVRLVPMLNGMESDPVATSARTMPEPVLEYDASVLGVLGAGSAITTSWRNTGTLGRSMNAAAFGGPTVGTHESKSHVALVRASQQHFQVPALSLSTQNRGLTLFLVGRFVGDSGAWERFLDFGNGPTSENIQISRSGTSNDVYTEVYNAGPLPLASVKGPFGTTAASEFKIHGTSITNSPSGGTALCYVDAPSNYPFDDPAAPPRTTYQALFSVYRLRAGYADSIFQIRRGSDNAISDFLGDENGNLVQRLGTGATIQTWLGGATAYVAVWYDQSGNGRNATQATTGSQPILDVTNKRVDFGTDSTKYLIMPSSTVPIGDSKYTFVVQHGVVNNAGGGFIGSGAFAATNDSNSFRRGGTNQYVNYWVNNDLNSSAVYAADNSVAVTYNQTQRTFYARARGAAQYTTAGSGGGTGRNSTSTNNWLGRSNPTNAFEYLNGTMYNAYIFNTDLTPTQLDAIYSPVPADIVVPRRFAGTRPTDWATFATPIADRTSATNFIGKSLDWYGTYPFTTGHIRHIIMYDRALTAAEMVHVMDALCAKWLPAPVLELDAMQFSTRTAGEGLASWLNTGSLAVTATSGPNRPTVGFLNGKPHVSFARASSQYFALSSIPFTWFQTGPGPTYRGYTVFLVARYTGAALAWERFFEFTNQTEYDFTMLRPGGLATVTMYSKRNGNSAQVDAGVPFEIGILQNTAFRILAVTATNSASGGTATVYADSSSAPLFYHTFATPLQNRTTTSNYIGRDWAGTCHLNGDIRHISLYDRAMNPTEIAQVMGRLAARWA